MSFLLDTGAVSELLKPTPDVAVLGAIESLSSELSYLSTITVGELIKGLQLMPFGRRQSLLEREIDKIVAGFGDRILPISVQTGRIWGQLSANVHRTGGQLAVADGLIAATAAEHGLTVVTRNVRDFELTGVKLFNPWQE